MSENKNKVDHRDFSNPQRECDIVMKGGITSGVVYPEAICELATEYSFKEIGGTSAGAIAAAFTAAAEYYRVKSKSKSKANETAENPAGKGFDGLKALSRFLQKNLIKLFQPEAATRPLYNMLLTGLKIGKKSPPLKVLWLLGALYKNFWKGALVGIIFGMLPVIFILAPWNGLNFYFSPRSTTPLGIFCFVLDILRVFLIMPSILALGGTIGAIVNFICRAVTALPENGYGLTTGLGDKAFCNTPTKKVKKDNNPKALSGWMADELDKIADTPSDRPLTLGDLWSADGDAKEKIRGLREKMQSAPGGKSEIASQILEQQDLAMKSPAINLQLLTTNLTFGRPYKLPFSSAKFFYDPDEFKKFFPDRIVDWMVNNPRLPKKDRDEHGREKESSTEKMTWDFVKKKHNKDFVEREHYEESGKKSANLLPLPHPFDFPVVVAARMSLSFPILISGIPLYAIDWTGLESYLLTPEQIKYSKRFFDKVKHSKDALPTYIRKKLPVGELDDKSILKELNKLIRGKCIFEKPDSNEIVSNELSIEKPDFNKIVTNDELRALINSHLNVDDVKSDESEDYTTIARAIDINRKIIEAAYHGLIRENDKKVKPFVIRKCIFSDGGICSNFPLFLFDNPLPSRPTFGFNLLEVEQESKKPQNNVKLVRDNQKDGLSESWDRFANADSRASQLIGFLMAVINTMYNWADNTLMRVPGYRDRVVHIELTKDEGGLNLNMDDEVIRKLTERGRIAGAALRDRFTGEEPGSVVTWDNHRWIRYRSYISLLDKALKDFHTAYNAQSDGNLSSIKYPELIEGIPPEDFHWSTIEQKKLVFDVFTQELMEFVEKCKDLPPPNAFADGAPEPIPLLSIRPDM